MLSKFDKNPFLIAYHVYHQTFLFRPGSVWNETSNKSCDFSEKTFFVVCICFQMKCFGWFIIILALLTIVATVIVLVIVWNEDSLVVGDDDVNQKEELYALTIIHINDFHARFEETNERSLPCQENDKCIGGFARMKTVVDQLKAKRKNSIFLNAGDNFQGTFWYNLLRYNVTSHFLNLLPADAITLGNHEFAHRIQGLVPFMKLLESPITVANIDDQHEPALQNLYQKSIILERNGRQIGVIGVILRETSDIAITDGLKFTDEIEAIRHETTKLRQQGVNIIIVLSHCGLARDREIAIGAGDFVDVIVGGHSHSFLYTSYTNDKRTPGPDTPVGTYPIIVTPKSGSGRRVLIVQASAYTKYVGDLTVYFNAAGHVKYYDGNPIFLSNDVLKDPDIEKELIPWREQVNKLGQRVVGNSSENLLNVGCRHGECALGSFAADAFVYETQIEFPELQVFSSIIQAGGIQNSFTKGDITYGDIVAFMPFENTLDILQLQGDVLIDLFEHSVSRSFSEDIFIGNNMLQVSGFQLTFNTTKPVGQRLHTIQIRSKQFGEFENINPHKLYNVVVPSFIANGGDGFTMIKSNRKTRRVGLLDIDVMEKFIARNSPISYNADGRITMLN